MRALTAVETIRFLDRLNHSRREAGMIGEFRNYLIATETVAFQIGDTTLAFNVVSVRNGGWPVIVALGEDKFTVLNDNGVVQEEFAEA